MLKRGLKRAIVDDTTLKLSPGQRRELHVAAAKQHGFKLDLTKK